MYASCGWLATAAAVFSTDGLAGKDWLLRDVRQRRIFKPVFTRYAEDYFSDEEMADLQRYLSKNAKSGDVVPGTGGVRKLRWSRAGMGKRGGVRILYYVQDTKGRIWLLTVYAKSARENIPASTLSLLREMADHAEIE